MLDDIHEIPGITVYLDMGIQTMISMATAYITYRASNAIFEINNYNDLQPAQQRVRDMLLMLATGSLMLGQILCVAKERYYEDYGLSYRLPELITNPWMATLSGFAIGVIASALLFSSKNFLEGGSTDPED
jgi:hypothetical protein